MPILRPAFDARTSPELLSRLSRRQRGWEVERSISIGSCRTEMEALVEKSTNADIAQLVEQVIRNDQVVGSNPTIGFFSYTAPAWLVPLAADRLMQPVEQIFEFSREICADRLERFEMTDVPGILLETLFVAPSGLGANQSLR